MEVVWVGIIVMGIRMNFARVGESLFGLQREKMRIKDLVKGEE